MERMPSFTAARRARTARYPLITSGRSGARLHRLLGGRALVAPARASRIGGASISRRRIARGAIVALGQFVGSIRLFDHVQGPQRLVQAVDGVQALHLASLVANQPA